MHLDILSLDPALPFIFSLAPKVQLAPVQSVRADKSAVMVADEKTLHTGGSLSTSNHLYPKPLTEQ